MKGDRPALVRVLAVVLYAALAVRTAWLNAVLPPEVDGTPIMGMTMIVLSPLSVAALIFVALDVRRMSRGMLRDWRVWLSLCAQLAGVVATGMLLGGG